MREPTQREAFVIMSLIHNLPTAMQQATRMPNHCIAATAVAVEIFKKMKISARPTPVDVGVFNELGWECFVQGIDLSQWPRNAWSVGVTHDSSEPHKKGAWNGHLVVRLPELGTIIDFNCAPLSRPEHGITLEPQPLRIEMDEFLRGQSFVGKMDRTVFMYSHSPDNTLWKAAPDWLKRKEKYSDVVDWVSDNLIKEMEERDV